MSVRRPYEWKKGKYTYKIVRMDKEEVDGKSVTWVGAFAYSHAKDENVFVGALRFKGENLVLARNLASFVEIYGGRIPVDQIPKVTVTFGNLVVNGKAAHVVSAHANYPKNVPDYVMWPPNTGHWSSRILPMTPLLFKHVSPLPLGEGQGVREIQLLSRPALTLTLSQRERGRIWPRSQLLVMSLNTDTALAAFFRPMRQVVFNRDLAVRHPRCRRAWDPQSQVHFRSSSRCRMTRSITLVRFSFCQPP